VILACLCILVNTITVLSAIPYEQNYRHFFLLVAESRWSKDKLHVTKKMFLKFCKQDP